MSLYSRFVASLGTRTWFARVIAPVAAPADRLAYRLTGHRRMITPSDIPALMLHVAGRTSGKRRSSPLLYLEDSDGYVVVGTNWGRSSTPEWVLNLEANPAAQVEVRRTTFEVTAEVIDPEEQGPWWSQFDAMWPGYESYRQRAADRSIRMFRLRRI